MFTLAPKVGQVLARSAYRKLQISLLRRGRCREVAVRMTHTQARFVIQKQRSLQMHRRQVLGGGIILGTALVVSLVAVGVMQHRASAQGSGIGLLSMDVALLVAYGSAGMIVWKQESPSVITAAMVGAQVGLILAAVQISNHLVEAFVPARPFVLIISPVLLMLALFGAAGAAAWERTRSLALAGISGVCCAIVAAIVTLCIAISFNLLFATRVDWQLREAFSASGMID